MKLLKLSIAAIATAVITASFPLLSLKAASITEQPVPQNQIVAVAVPAGSIGYNLAVVEQIPNKQKCWSETGSQPTIVDPLWTTFDFTGSCSRSTDSNGYSVRVDGQDTSLDYSLEVVEKDNELQLVARNRNDRSQTTVGKSFGKANGQYIKMYLNPGWQFTKKTVDGKVLGHFFFSGDSAAIAAAGDNIPVPPKAPSFSDTANDIYKDEIEEAVALGFIAGFEDKTFRPAQPLTREQLVSMVFGSLAKIPNLNLQAATQVAAAPYPDVNASRWSAAKIDWAKTNQIVKGYPDGTFQPEKPVTRAELVTVLQNAAKFAKTKQGAPAELTGKTQPVAFADTTNHWGAATIQTMSAFCNVASPYNETGNSFQPDTESGRNYAAAATYRMHDCLAGKPQAAKKPAPTVQKAPREVEGVQAE
jgi:N-acetylmuramoyl-L-alanine amidase